MASPRAPWLSDPDPELSQPSDDVSGLPSWLGHQLHPWKPAKHGGEGSLQLESGQRRSQAEVDPGPEGQVGILLPGDVQLVGEMKDGWVVVR